MNPVRRRGGTVFGFRYVFGYDLVVQLRIGFLNIVVSDSVLKLKISVSFHTQTIG